MDFSEYQLEARKTDNLNDDTALMIAFLGLGGEVGSLMTELKKRYRDDFAHKKFQESVVEELGDVLWYISTVATRLGMDLSEVAEFNLAKIEGRWGYEETADRVELFDKNFPLQEQFPRKLMVEFLESSDSGRKVVTLVDLVSKKALGDALRNNAYEDDGYRFHDVLHFAFMAKLGWSPVLRKLLCCKRKSDPLVDEIEDGGRAQVLEEAIVALAYDYASRHALLEGVNVLDYSLLTTISSLIRGNEVSRCTLRQWESAILEGFSVWRKLSENLGGIVLIDLDSRSIKYCPGSTSSSY